MPHDRSKPQLCGFEASNRLNIIHRTEKSHRTRVRSEACQRAQRNEGPLDDVTLPGGGFLAADVFQADTRSATVRLRYPGCTPRADAARRPIP